MASAVKFEGSVEKISGIFKNKTRIWMVLEGLTLTYYKDQQKSFCVGSVDVSEVQTARQTGRKHGCEFEVTTKSTAYTFTAEADELAKAWVHAIQLSMQQKSTVRAEPAPTMNSDYAQIADVAPVRENSARARIYEEIGELPSSGERNIFGVKLRSSFQKANALPTKSQVLEEPTVPKQPASISSFKPVGIAPIGRQLSSEKVSTRQEPPVKTQPTNTTTTTPDDPVYAKPNKPFKTSTVSTTTSEKKKVGVKTIADKFKRPPPTFSPPPPPVGNKKRNDEPQEVNEPTYALPCDNVASTDKANTAKATPVESEYAQIDDEVLKNLKAENDASASKENSDDEHTYYLADSVSRDQHANNNNGSVKEAETPASKSGAKTSTQSSNSKDNTDVEKRDTTHPEDIDVSQVVRRKRGSHVTNSFSEDSLDSTDAADRSAVLSRGRMSTAERRANFRSKVEDDIAEDTYENNDVFINQSQKNTQSEQEVYEGSSYEQALESVIGSMINSVKDNAIANGLCDNGEAYTSLKDYLMRNSTDGFDIESHTPSYGDSVERLHALLSEEGST